MDAQGQPLYNFLFSCLFPAQSIIVFQDKFSDWIPPPYRDIVYAQGHRPHQLQVMRANARTTFEEGMFPTDPGRQFESVKTGCQKISWEVKKPGLIASTTPTECILALNYGGSTVACRVLVMPRANSLSVFIPEASSIICIHTRRQLILFELYS